MESLCGPLLQGHKTGKEAREKRGKRAKQMGNSVRYCESSTMTKLTRGYVMKVNQETHTNAVSLSLSFTFFLSFFLSSFNVRTASMKDEAAKGTKWRDGQSISQIFGHLAIDCARSLASVFTVHNIYFLISEKEETGKSASDEEEKKTRPTRFTCRLILQLTLYLVE